MAREKEKAGIDERDDDGDLKEIEKDGRFKGGLPMCLGQKQHHQNRGAVDAEQETPRRVRQDVGIVEDVVDLDGRRNQQNRQCQSEQAPEQGVNAAGALERNPGAGQSHEAGKNDSDLGQHGAGVPGTE